MGLFGGSKTYVASTVYNLAGDQAERPSYLKSLVAGNVISNSKFSIADTLQSGYMNGPSIKARSFYRWALEHYDKIGVPPMTLITGVPYSEADIEPHIPTSDGETASILAIEQGSGDISFWAERHIIRNYPTRINTDWDVDFTGGATATVKFASDGLETTFFPADPEFDIEGQYFYVSYDRKVDGSTVGQDVWIYLVGSGNAYMDSLVGIEAKSGHFFPFIPIRHETEFLSENYLPETYELSKRAYKKATGDDIDNLIEKIADNKDIGDIDYAYIVYGVPLNARDNSARRYLFEFFKSVIADLPEETATSRIRIKSPGSAQTKLNITISWTSITLSSGSGFKKDGAKVGKVWLTSSAGAIEIHRQLSISRWETVTINGLRHENMIYNSKSVVITGSEALDDADESGFIVPLHYEIMRSMSLVDSTQMMTASTFILFNSYQVVKQKWYQTGIFKIFVFVLAIALTVAFAPAGVGLLGANLAVGAAVGFSGVAAVIAGAVINALAAMILIQIIQTGATAVFGEKFGAIIGTIVSVVALQVGTGLMNGMSTSAMWGQMMSAPNLMRMTSSVGNGVAGYMQASAQEWVLKTEEMNEAYEKESKRIADLYAENIGYSRGVLDPMSLTDVEIGGALESEAVFLHRTLMTGSDIAEMSMDMLTNFADYTVSTALPLQN